MVGRGPMGRAEGRHDQSREECIVPIIVAAVSNSALAAIIAATVVAVAVSIIVTPFVIIGSTPSAAVFGMERPTILLQIRQQIGPLLLGQWLRLSASTTATAAIFCHHGRRLRELRGRGIIVSVGVGGEGPAQ